MCMDTYEHEQHEIMNLVMRRYFKYHLCECQMAILNLQFTILKFLDA